MTAEVLAYVASHIAMRAHAIGVQLPEFKVTVRDAEKGEIGIHFDGYLSPGVINVIGDWLYVVEDRPPPTYLYVVSFVGRSHQFAPIDPKRNYFGS